MEIPIMIPEHDCPGEGCPYPPGFFLGAYEADDKSGVEHSLQVHGVSIKMIAESLVTLFDNANLEDDSDIPKLIQFELGRETLRRAIERTTPPDEVMDAIKEMGEG